MMQSSDDEEAEFDFDTAPIAKQSRKQQATSSEEEEEDEEEEDDADDDDDDDDDPRNHSHFSLGDRVKVRGRVFGGSWARDRGDEYFTGTIIAAKGDDEDDEIVWEVVYDEDGDCFATCEADLEPVSERDLKRKRNEVCYNEMVLSRRVLEDRAARAARRQKARVVAVPSSNDEDDDFDEEDERPRRRKRASPAKVAIRASSRQRVAANYCEDSLSSDEEDDWLMKKRRTSPLEEDEQMAAQGDGANEAPSLEVERLLGRYGATAEEWRSVLAKMNSAHTTRGSVWEQEDSSKSDNNTERYLVKWKKLSYLHCSWETEADLKSQVGDAEIKRALTSLSRREMVGESSESIHARDAFDASFVEVERILDVHDGTQWLSEDAGKRKKAPSALMTAVEAMQFMINDDTDDVPTAETEVLRLLAPTKIVVKWRGLGYSEATEETWQDARCLAEPGTWSGSIDAELRSAAAACARRLLLSATARTPRARLSKKESNSDLVKAAVPRTSRDGTLELKPYQVEGVAWLCFNLLNKRNCILADEMGLGKTVQTVTLLRMAKLLCGATAPVLIVAPLSTLAHWQRELARWTCFDSAVYHGSPDDRDACRERDVFAVRGAGRSAGLPRVDVVVTTPEQLLLDDARSTLGETKWSVIVVDEAHRLKNANSRLYRALSGADDTSSKAFWAAQFKVLLTGTPLQNHLDELWALLSFCDPMKFPDCDDFLERYANCRSASDSASGEVKTLGGLLEVMQPYVLRREKSQVEKAVPPKSEIVVDCALTAMQKRYYRALYEKNVAMLAGVEGRKDGPSLTNLAMELRKCCNHPYLLQGAEDRERRVSSDSASDEADKLVRACGKLQFVDKLLPRLKQQGSRVLIFSQFTTMLNIIEDYLSARGYGYGRIDGGVTGRDRQKQIDEFCVDGSELLVMLLSTRAGGVGINLVAADTVVIYDSDWNPQNDIQAMARCHRIGQTKRVTVYRLLTKGTYESQMYDAATAKLDLDRAVLDGIAKQPNNKRSADLQEELLRRAARAVDFKVDTDTSDDAFGNADLDAILATHTREVVVRGNGSSASGGLESLSTATFINNQDDGVALDDPDFWAKTLGPSLVASVSGGQPSSADRQRRRVRRCGSLNYAEDDVDDDLLSVDESDDARYRKQRRGRANLSASAEPPPVKIPKKSVSTEWAKSHAAALRSRITTRAIGSSPDDFVSGSRELALRAEKTSLEAIHAAARQVILSHALVVARQMTRLGRDSTDDDDESYSVSPEAAGRVLKKNRAVRAALEAEFASSTMDELASKLATWRGPPASLKAACANDNDGAKSSQNVLERCHELEVARIVCSRLVAFERNQRRLSTSTSAAGGSPRPKKISSREKLVTALGGNDPPSTALGPAYWWGHQHDCSLLKGSARHLNHRGGPDTAFQYLDLFLDPKLDWPHDIRDTVIEFRASLGRSHEPEDCETAAADGVDFGKAQAKRPSLPHSVPSKDALRKRIKKLVEAAEDRSTGRMFALDRDRDRKKKQLASKKSVQDVRDVLFPPTLGTHIPKKKEREVIVLDDEGDDHQQHHHSFRDDVDDRDHKPRPCQSEDDNVVLLARPPTHLKDKENGVAQPYVGGGPSIPKKSNKQTHINAYFARR